MYIIAEIGTNHDGDPDKAIKLVKAAIGTGVDAVKLQLFEADTLVRKDMPALSHAGTHKTQWERMKSLELPWGVYERAKDECLAAGKDFIITPFSSELCDKAATIADKIKIASGDLTYQPLLERARHCGKPVILSTGMASFEEIRIAAAAVSPWAVLHCISKYPARPDEIDLGMITWMVEVGQPGYSDHCVGNLACLAAVAAGARVIEKHFTLDHSLHHGDHSHSLDPNEMSETVEALKAVDLMNTMWMEKRPDSAMRKYLRRGPDGLRGDYE